MRADRLVATLLVLQARGTVTAAEVADELEVSERTARRDLDALAMSGIPLYSKQGRGGGWTLVGGATTNLTGLRSPEARALMTMAAASGRFTPELASAMRKITQAMPEPVRDEVAQIMSSVMSDSTSWGNRAASVLHEKRRDDWLDPLQRSVIERRCLALTYDTPRTGTSRRTVKPLGLVVKQGYWYLLADTEGGRRSFRVDRIIDVEPTPDRFDPPEDFDLERAWEEITQRYAERAAHVAVEAIVDDEWIPRLRLMGVETIVHGAAAGDGGVGATSSSRSHVTLGSFKVEVLAAQLAGVMTGIELIDPPAELVACLAATGRELTSRFDPEAGSSPPASSQR